MIRIKYHSPGTPPGTLVPPAEIPAQAPVLSLIQYDAESIFEGVFDTFAELLGRFDPSKVNWINIDGLGDVKVLEEVARHFGIHALAMEDVLNTAQRPKIELFNKHFFIVSEMLYTESDKRMVIEQLSLFLGENFVVTIQEESEHDVFQQVRKRLREGRGFARKMRADYLAYALLDATVDQFFPVLETIGEGIEEIEEELLDKPSKQTLRRLYEAKRLLLQLRRAAWPQREIFSALMRDDSGIVCHETQVFLRDCYDHTTQIIDILESFRDLAAGLMDVYISSLGFRTNEIMRVLTVFSVIFMPLTFIAGVYGMNFNTEQPLNMPELNWPFGYIACLGVMATIVICMVIFFKRKRWL